MTDKYAILALDDAALLMQCRTDVFVGTGRGGQKRNKTSTAVRLVFLPENISVTDDTSRSQHLNRSLALRKLRIAIALAPLSGENPPPLPRDIPDMTAIPGEKSPLYAIWLAKAIDILRHYDFNISGAAEHLGCSPTRLTRILQKQPLLWQLILQHRNKIRQTAAKSPEAQGSSLNS